MSKNALYWFWIKARVRGEHRRRCTAPRFAPFPCLARDHERREPARHWTAARAQARHHHQSLCASRRRDPERSRRPRGGGNSEEATLRDNSFKRSHERFDDGRSCEMTVCPLRGEVASEVASVCRTAWGMMAKLMFATVTVVIVGGCAGNMRGMVRGEGTPVIFSYEQGMLSDLYSAKIDGESFSGRAVMVDGRETLATAFGTASDAQATRFATSQVFSYSTSGRFKATLLGDRGSTLRCLMQYADSSGFTTPGGVGECIHSDGRVIDIVW